MAWRVIVYVFLVFLTSFCFGIPAGATDGIPPDDGRYRAFVTLRTDEGTSVTHHELTLPWHVTAFGDKAETWKGSVHVDFEHGDDGTFAWDGHAQLRGRRLTAGLYLRRPHRSSKDPFKLVHASARGGSSVAAVLDWTGTAVGAGTLQYVGDVPLRRSTGALLAARLEIPSSEVAVGLTAYGSERVQHWFATVDGRGTLGDQPLLWGGAFLRGVEVTDDAGPGLLDHRPVQSGALFLRTEWRHGVHSGWTRIHATGADFRSLVADTYPFSRGKVGVEGRWQWRLGTSKLFSVYAQHLRSISSEFPGKENKVELGFSSMVRNRWGWRLSLEGAPSREQLEFGRLEATLTNPDRRFEWTIGTTPRRGDPVRWRHRLQWEQEGWRARLVVDETFRAWRAEARATLPAGWSWTIVYKVPFTDRSDLPDRWWHGEVRRFLAGFGELWFRYMAPDLGRIDVGWRRPPTVSVGVDVSF